MTIKAVGFDVDGTLYPNSAMYIQSAWFALRHLRRVHAYSRVRREMRRQRPIDDLRVLERELLAGRLGIPERDAARFIDEVIHDGWESILDRVQPFPGVHECVEALRAAGLRVGVSSDFPVARKLGRLGFDGLFDCALWSEESGYLKPNPEPFIALSECLQAEPSQVVYVGNSYDYDIVGAKNVGMTAVHLARRPVAGGTADYTTRSFDDLCAWILDRIG
ncbi:MAG: HAD family hydrolase [Spirochaetaceae bacterium]|nr:MAG: HAD family hydrolase [Spirochaetaceae bacterium]